MADTWRGVHTWTQLDPERFAAHADRVNNSVMAAVGSDPRAVVQVAGLDVADAAPELMDLLERARADRERAEAGEQEEISDQARLDQDSDLDRVAVSNDPAEEEQAQASADERGAVATAAEAEAAAAEASAGITETHAYDSEDRRSATAAALRDAGVPDQAIAAKMTADHLNGQNPRRSAAAAGIATTRRPARGRAKTAQQGRESGLDR